MASKIMPITLDLYKQVYECKIETDEMCYNKALDEVFRYLNVFRPADFCGHSLSTSDIVKMDDKYYYCDSYGWVDVTDKVVKKQTKTYKVTYFTKELEVENVITYPNIADQGFLLDTIAVNIYTLELAEVVKCETEDESYTQAVNELIKGRLARLAA